MKVYFQHTRSPNGGFGVLGKGIFREMTKSPRFQVLGYQMQLYMSGIPDVIITYGMPDQIRAAKDFIEEKLNAKDIFHVHYVVWESSQYPPEYALQLFEADLLLTATKYTQKALQDTGLSPKVWHHGVDARFQYREAVDDGIFTFLHYNAYEFRKGWEILLEAFTKEFYLDEPVKLIMKARERQESVWFFPEKRMLDAESLRMYHENRQQYLASRQLDHPLIEEIIGHVSDEEMVAMNMRADCFVFPAKGEGWGLPPFEAAAMGITPIIPDKGAFTEWINLSCMIRVANRGYINAAPRYPGYLFYPSVSDLRKKMRWAFENQDKVKEMGRQASMYIHEAFNWDRIINKLYKLISVATSTKANRRRTRKLRGLS